MVSLLNGSGQVSTGSQKRERIQRGRIERDRTGLRTWYNGSMQVMPCRTSFWCECTFHRPDEHVRAPWGIRSPVKKTRSET